ncbi:MAG TPA: nucleotidyltransferase family protein [Thermoanaerobaculia bacterium]|nr:nucleotidyltransferase family protein [Thermoanaerobaculia bacterium]
MEAFQVSPIPPHLREPLRAALRGETAPWPALAGDEVRLLAEHGVAPLVYAAQPLDALRATAIRAAAFEPLRAADLTEVLAALAARGIETLITKGTALAYDVYAAPELRPRGDVDLLVSRADADAAIELFRELGFASRLTSGDEHNVRQLTLTRERHEYDLHWDVANSPLFASALQFDRLRARAIRLPRLGAHARGLSHGDALMLACIHRVAHHHDLERLIWLVDIALLRERMSHDEHARFWRDAAEARVVGVCVRSIELAEEWMGSRGHPPAAEFLTAEELSRDEPSRAFLDPDLRYGDVMLANLRALPWRARAERLWQLAFPPRAFMRQTFGGGVLPWLYVRRGARGVAKLFRRML